MISPKVYEKQINELGIEGMIVAAENSEEASNLLDALQDVEKLLIRIKANVRMDIRVIRKKFIEKIKKIDDSSKKSREKPLKIKIMEKKALSEERDLQIAPYETIESTIDHYLYQIKEATDYLNEIIDN